MTTIDALSTLFGSPFLAEVVESGPIRWTQAPPAWAIVLLLLALMFGVRWIYRRERQRVSRPVRILLGGLRILAVAIVALVLFAPVREEITKAQDKSHLVVLVDTSASMTTKDRYRPEDEEKLLSAAYPEGGPDSRPSRLDLSRADIVGRTLAGSEEPVLRALAERFVLHAYAFDEDLRSLASTEPKAGAPEPPAGTKPVEPAEAVAQAIRDALPAAEPERRAADEPRHGGGQRTDIGAALKGIAREFLNRDDRRLAGVILLSDGRDNAEGEKPVQAVTALGKGAEDLRVAAVALGDARLAKNLRVDRVSAKDVVLVQDDVTFLAQLRQTGFDDLSGVTVGLKIEQVAGPDGRPFETPRLYSPPRPAVDRTSAQVTLQPGTKETPVSLRAQFMEAGTFDVQVRATLPNAQAAEDAILEDDVRTHRLRVVDATIRVLLCDREMRYETHFLKNVLVRERRHAGDPRRVDAQVWIQSFDPDVRQPSGHAVPLRAFPNTRQEIFSYDVVIFGDVDWRLLGPTVEKSREILGLLKDFVDQGGGMAFVAGEDEDPTKYVDTPLQDLLPVSVRATDRSNDSSKTVPFRIAPTEFGRENPILAVLQDRPEKVDEIWREHAGWEWYWLYRARGGLKPGAVAFARVFPATTPEFLDERGEPLVVFAGMGYGKGRVFFSAIDQISRIRMSVADTYYGPFWDETIRWLATYRLLGGNKRYKIETDKDRYFVGETATIKVSALDSDYQPLREPVLRGLQVEGPDGRPLLTEADAARPDPEGGPGLFRTAVRLPSSGSYRIYVDPPSRDGGSRAEKSIEARFATREDQDKLPDHETLRAVVKATNPPTSPPRLWSPWQLSELAASIPARTTERVLDRKEISLWDGPWPLILATAILALEWILRKKFQMI